MSSERRQAIRTYRGSVGNIGLRARGLGEPAFLLRDGLGTVALCIDDAEKPKGLLAISQKLMGGPGSNVYGIKRLHLPGLIVQYDRPCPRTAITTCAWACFSKLE